MTTGREDDGHTSSVAQEGPGGLWDDGYMTGTPLVARLHVDLQRVASAACPAV